MTQWEIWSYSFPEGEHPAVILSPSEVCSNADIDDVNVLFASSARPLSRGLKAHEVALDQTDGLDWKTCVRCHRIYLVPKNELARRRGVVSLNRRREIGRKLVEVFRLPL